MALDTRWAVMGGPLPRYGVEGAGKTHKDRQEDLLLPEQTRPFQKQPEPGAREGSSAQGHRLRDALRGPPMGPPLMRLHPRISPAAPLGISTSLISRPDRPPHPEISTRLPVTAHKLPILRSAINTRFRTHLNSF